MTDRTPLERAKDVLARFIVDAVPLLLVSTFLVALFAGFVAITAPFFNPPVVPGVAHVQDGLPPVVTVFRDPEHAVTCWTTGTAMACLRDDHVEDWESPGGRCP